MCLLLVAIILHCLFVVFLIYVDIQKHYSMNTIQLFHEICWCFSNQYHIACFFPSGCQAWLREPLHHAPYVWSRSQRPKWHWQHPFTHVRHLESACCGQCLLFSVYFGLFIKFCRNLSLYLRCIVIKQLFIQIMHRSYCLRAPAWMWSIEPDKAPCRLQSSPLLLT